MLIGVVIGGTAVSTAAIIYNIISKSNIAEKIKEVFFRNRAAKDENITANTEENPFAAIVKEKQKDSVSVDVFLGNADDIKTEEVIVEADEVADDINEGDWISLED